MKPATPIIRNLLFAVWCLLCIGLTAARGQVVLIVDVTDPAAVTFTATGTFSAADATATSNFPIQLKGFLTSNPGQSGQTASSTTLQTTGADHSLNSALWGRFNPVETTLVLRNAALSETFSVASAAFTGTATFDLTSIKDFLPSAGTSGSIVSSLGGSGSGITIGTYSIVTTAVPEPVTYGLAAGLACLGLALRQKRIKPKG